MSASDNNQPEPSENSSDDDVALFKYVGIGIAALTGLAVFIIIAYSFYSFCQERAKKKRDVTDSRRTSRTHRSVYQAPEDDDFTYVSPFVKYTLFFWNFFIMMIGSLIIGIGIYAVHAGGEFENLISGEHSFDEVSDLISHVPLIVVITGSIIFTISFAGCIGSLRENLCLLRMYSITMLLIFLGELAMIGLGYYFSGKVRNFLEDKVGPKIIENYRENDDFGNIIDLTQEYFQCCGISNDGYKQWNENEYFCCHDPNPPLGNNCTAKFPDTFKDKKDWIVHRETCGVPHSCCITKNETMRNLQCGDTLQDDDKSVDAIDQFRPKFNKVNDVIYTTGCLKKLYEFVDINLYTMAYIGGGILVSELMLMYLVKKLETQILMQMNS